MKEVTPCPEWEQQLSCTHPEDLSSVEQLALMAHVAKCSACARTRAHYLETDDLLRSLPPIEPLPSLPTQVQHRRKRKDARVVSFSVLLSVTVSTVARHAVLRQQPHIAETLNSIVVSPSTTEVSDKAGQTSSQPLQKQRLPGRRSRKRSLIPVSTACVVADCRDWSEFLGIYCTRKESRRQAQPLPLGTPRLLPLLSRPWSLRQRSIQSSILSWPRPMLARLTDLQANVPSPMTLTQMRQQEGRISGSFSAMHISAIVQRWFPRCA